MRDSVRRVVDDYLMKSAVAASMRDSVRRVVDDYLTKSAVAASGQCGMGDETQIPPH